MDGILPGSLKYETSSNSFQQAIRRASKNIIYMTINAMVQNLDYVEATGDSSMLRPTITGPILAIWEIGFLALDLLAVILFALALRTVLRDSKNRRTPT